MSRIELSPSISQETLAQGKILVMTLSDMSPETLDLWYAACLAYMKQCYQNGWQLRALQDYSRSNEALTPYSQELGGKLVQAYPSVGGRVAIIYPKAFTSSIIHLSMFLRSLQHSHRTRRMFLERESAIAWLRKGLNRETLD